MTKVPCPHSVHQAFFSNFIGRILRSACTIYQRAMYSGPFVAMTIGIAYSLIPHENSLSKSIYSISGYVFWISFYGCMVSALCLSVVVAVFVDKWQKRFPLVSNKFELAYRFYEDLGQGVLMRSGPVLFCIFAFLTALLVSVTIGLGVTKIFVLGTR